MKILKYKWVVFLVLILSFVLLDMQIRSISLAQRGIVLGIGIDKESDEYVVTTEILAPSNLGAENYQKNRLLALERGKTLEEAFERMDKSLGVRISLRHTVLIVLGESMLKSGEYGPLIDLFVGNDVSDSTYIVGVDNSASSLFSAKPPLYSTISYKIAETFRSPDIESGLVSTNVKDFLSMYMSKSGSIYIPLVEKSHGNIAESNGMGDKETDSINFGKIAVLDRTGQKLILSSDESEGLSYIYSAVNEANIYVENIGGKSGFDMDIIDTNCLRKYDVRNRRVILDVKMWVKMGERKSASPDDYIAPFGEEEKRLAGETIKNQIKSAYLVCHKEGVDILGIATGFYRQLGKKYESVLGSDYLDNIAVEPRVTLIVK